MGNAWKGAWQCVAAGSILTLSLSAQQWIQARPDGWRLQSGPTVSSGSISYLEGFETGDGTFQTYGTTPTWAWGVPRGDFIPAAASGQRAWVTNLTGNYIPREFSYLESPPLDLTSLTSDPILQFRHIFDLNFDGHWVEVSMDGGPYTKLGATADPGSRNWYNRVGSNWWEGNSGVAGTWLLARHRLDGGAGSVVRIRWVLQSRSSSSSYEGVGVDDVQVFSSWKDVGVASIDTPILGNTLSAAETITVTLDNYGSTNEPAVPVQLTVTGPMGSSSSEIVPTTLVPVSPTQFTFAATADMSTPGSYTISVATQLSGDQNPGNDGLSMTVVQQPTFSAFPYFEDFESGDGGYVGAGIGSTWEFGIPSGGWFNTAASGQRAWVTNLDGQPAEDEQSYLVSPVFDCTAVTSDLFLGFSGDFDLSNSDQSWVELSLDGGPWLKVGAKDDPASLNWYNDGFDQAWSGRTASTSQWRTVQHILPGSAGSLIRFRIVLELDRQQGYEGVGVDDVALWVAPFAKGQAPRPSLAEMDVNDAFEAVGFPVDWGYPGPYYTTVSAANETFDLSFRGGAAVPAVLLGGSLSVGAVPFAGGQLDLGAYEVWAAGVLPGGINPFFVTSAQGDMSFSVSVPSPLVGQVVTFQGILVPGPEFYFTNAVQVVFLP